ncbi:helix-turn-helix transcriptional regulator, partial [Salmonella enterica]|nr:helix-turn-helix transcriptional regulator [Salmonella enterica]
MMNMSRDYAKKLKAIRRSEHLTQSQFADITGVSVGAVSNYESGYRPARIEIVERVIQVERFEKYTMWLLHDKTFPSAG